MDDFDKAFTRTFNFSIIWFIFCAVLSCGGLAFLGWVVVKVMAHFGVL